MPLTKLLSKLPPYLKRYPIIVEATETVDRATNHKGSKGIVSKLSLFAASFIAVVTDRETDDERTRPQPRRQSHLQNLFIFIFWSHLRTLFYLVVVIHSILSRCSTARGSSAGFSQVSTPKVEALKSFLFTESSLVLKLKNTWLI